MLFSEKYINRLRSVSFSLFFLSAIGLIFSLLFHNLLVSFPFSSKSYTYGQTVPFSIICDEKNSYCTGINLKNITKFENCKKFDVYYQLLISDKKDETISYIIPFNEALKKELEELKQLSKSFNIKRGYLNKEKLSTGCIKNSKLYDLYKIFPKPFYLLEKIKINENYKPGTSTAINPFIYGEVSISNIVKRFPINYLFKPFMFITSLLMIFYWLTYQKIFTTINQKKRINKFTIFGVISGIFLFFHIFFLGTKIDNEIFNQIRKLILVLFILFEILAQFFLTKRLYFNIDTINNYISKKILNTKIIFVSLTLLSSSVIIVILTFFNLDSKIDYILEWNYFLLLLVFYLLSGLLWNKQKKIIL